MINLFKDCVHLIFTLELCFVLKWVEQIVLLVVQSPLGGTVIFIPQLWGYKRFCFHFKGCD